MARYLKKSPFNNRYAVSRFHGLLRGRDIEMSLLVATPPVFGAPIPIALVGREMG